MKHHNPWKTIHRASQPVFCKQLTCISLWNDSVLLIFILPCAAYLTAKVAGILWYLIQWHLWNHNFWRYEQGDSRFNILSLVKPMERFISCARPDLSFRMIRLLIFSKSEGMDRVGYRWDLYFTCSEIVIYGGFGLKKEWFVLWGPMMTI